MKLNKMMYPPKNIQDFQHENVHNNDGMENTDETRGDVEQNNDSFLEGCSTILGEQNIVQDGVIFIEDKMTLLDFDNAEENGSHPSWSRILCTVTFQNSTSV